MLIREWIEIAESHYCKAETLDAILGLFLRFCLFVFNLFLVGLSGFLATES